MSDLSVVLHRGFGPNAESQPARLGVMVTLLEMDNPENEHKQFYGMGSKAHLSFAPDPDTGKGLIEIPGAVAKTANESTNWNLFRKSLYDSGLPQGIFTNDLSVLDGTWVHVSSVPEPKERAGFQSNATGEMAEQPRQARTIAIVTEIKDNGKPWEGTGGIPDKKAAKAPAKAPAKAAAVPAKPAAKVNGKAPALDATDATDIMTAASAATTDVLTDNPNGLAKLKLRTSVFGIVTKKYGDDMAQAVTEAYFSGDDDALNGLLGDLGYQLNGAKIEAA